MGVPYIEKQFEQARRNQMNGRYAEAERTYRKILETQPNHADAMHFLGLLAHQTGHSEAAVPLMRRSITLDPSRSAYYNNLGEVFRVLGADRD